MVRFSFLLASCPRLALCSEMLRAVDCFVWSLTLDASFFLLVGRLYAFTMLSKALVRTTRWLVVAVAQGGASVLRRWTLFVLYVHDGMIDEFVPPF